MTMMSNIMDVLVAEHLLYVNVFQTIHAWNVNLCFVFYLIGWSLDQGTVLGGSWVGQAQLLLDRGRANAAGMSDANHSFPAGGKQKESWKR